MKEHLINLRAWEASALAEGRATALVRVCKPQPVVSEYDPDMLHFNEAAPRAKRIAPRGKVMPKGTFHSWTTTRDEYALRGPFGAPGDAILGREGMYLHKHAGSRGGWLYRADNSQVSVNASDHESVQAMREWAHKTARSHCTSTQMPSWAIRARYTNAVVRCLRVQDLTEQDARDLGFFASGWVPTSADPDSGFGDEYIPARGHYESQFDRDHGPGDWAANPWIFFARLTK